MAIHRHSVQILSVPSATAEVATGSTYRISPNDSDVTRDHDQTFAVHLTLTLSGGASPTGNIIIESSADGGTTWAQVAELGTLTGAGTSTKIVDVPRFAPLVRARTNLTGSPNHTAAAYLLSSDSFTPSVVA